MLDFLWARYSSVEDRAELRRRLQQVCLASCQDLGPLIPHPKSVLALKLANRVVQGLEFESLELSAGEVTLIGDFRDRRVTERGEGSWRSGSCNLCRQARRSNCSDCNDMTIADWFAEGAAFAFDYYTPEDLELTEMVTRCASIPPDEVKALLNPLVDAPTDARELLRSAAYFVDLAVNYTGITAHGDARPGRPSHDLFQSARLVRRYVPNPLDLWNRNTSYG
jgi:hypothetical protein